MQISLTEIFYSCFVSPKKAIQQIVVSPSLSSSILVVVFSLFAHTLSVLILLNFPGDVASKLLIYGFPLRLMVTVLVWIILAAVLHLMAEVLGGEGRAGTLFILFGYSLLPLNLSLPLSFIARGVSHPLIYLLGMIVILVWIIYNQIQGIKQVYRFELGQAVFTWLTPFLLGGTIILTSIASLIIGTITTVVALLG
ncbi:MAG: YIP1 family protein [Elusimicrobiota bacterium]